MMTIPWWSLVFLLQPGLRVDVRNVDSIPTLVSRTVFLMGTEVSCGVYTTDRANGIRDLEDYISILEATDEELSNYNTSSFLSRLNRVPADSPIPLTPTQCRTFVHIFDWTRKTRGAFDPGIEPLGEIWGLHSGGRQPTSQEIAAAVAISGLDRFHFDPIHCILRRPAEGGIDSGAFGKGEALDRILERFSLNPEADPGWVNLGGQVAVFGNDPTNEGWVIGIASPRARNEILFEVHIGHGSIAVSGNSERSLEIAGRRLGHILDPRTGYPAPFAGEVVVWHPSGLIADILSTALYVMGPEEGLEFAEKESVAACFLVSGSDQSLRTVSSRAFEPLMR